MGKIACRKTIYRTNTAVPERARSNQDQWSKLISFSSEDNALVGAPVFAISNGAPKLLLMAQPLSSLKHPHSDSEVKGGRERKGRQCASPLHTSQKRQYASSPNESYRLHRRLYWHTTLSTWI